MIRDGGLRGHLSALLRRCSADAPELRDIAHFVSSSAWEHAAMFASDIEDPDQRKLAICTIAGARTVLCQALHSQVDARGRLSALAAAADQLRTIKVPERVPR